MPKFTKLLKCYDQRLKLFELGEDDEFKGNLEVNDDPTSGYTVMISFMKQKKVAKSILTGPKKDPLALSTIEISQQG
jgi:hypothetical protein